MNLVCTFVKAMIKTLYIKNFALIDELEVHFEAGLNILTGQTGAGKSIILGALNMILGERADTHILRRGTDKAVAEAIFNMGDNHSIKPILVENAIELRRQLILRREIRDSGSRAFINDTPVTVAVLKSVGNFLVDLHGQHSHQLLLDEENHRSVVDGFGGIDTHLKAYRAAYQNMQLLRNELRDLRHRDVELQEKTELYRFQKEELEKANLQQDEEQQLEEEINLLSHAEDLAQSAESIIEAGNGSNGLMEKLNAIKMNLEDMARVEPAFESYLEEATEARISIQEMIGFCERYQSKIEINPQRLEQLRRRQNELNRLQNKYSRGLPELIAYLRNIKDELSRSENFELEIEKLELQIEDQAQHIKTAAVNLHQKRIETGKKLSQSIVDELSHLGIIHAEFEVRVDWNYTAKGWFEIDGRPVTGNEFGCDDVKLFISANKGEEPKPLASVASGGEISRVMLALKSTLAKQDSLPVMVFDEIDNGISGEISEKVGRTMRLLSNQCQIIAITHQPQIASQAHKHYRVQKTETQDRTATTIIPLSQREHIEEIAGLMSGDEITEAGLKSAQELVEKHTFKN